MSTMEMEKLGAMNSDHSAAIKVTRNGSGEKYSNDALSTNEQDMTRILDMFPGFVWTARPDGEIECSNQSVLDYTGMTLAELKNNWRSVVNPDDIAVRERALDLMARSGEPVERELRVRRFDGVYRWFHSRMRALRDEHGQVLRWYCISWDIEEHKRAEEALRESEHRLRLIIDTIPALVWVAKPDGSVEYTNQRVLDYFGVPEKDLAQFRWVHAVHPDDADAALRGWLRAVAAEASYEATHRHRSADGEYRWFQVRGEPLRDRDGRVLSWYGVTVDIDDRKQMEEALRSTRARLSRATRIATVAELSAAIAHEINQGLAAVVANGHALRRWLSSVSPNLERARLIAERIIRDGNSAADVVRRIRALFKQEAPTKVPLDVNEVIAEVLRLSGDKVRRKSSYVETDLEENLPMTLADRIQIQQVIINLVHNAIESMEDVTNRPRLLSIRSRRDATNIIVEIRDYGRGLENAEKIFEPFFTTKENGMGMGLAICRSIVEAHDGRLSATTSEKQGTTFCFTLPIRS